MLIAARGFAVIFFWATLRQLKGYIRASPTSRRGPGEEAKAPDGSEFKIFKWITISEKESISFKNFNIFWHK